MSYFLGILSFIVLSFPFTSAFRPTFTAVSLGLDLPGPVSPSSSQTQNEPNEVSGPEDGVSIGNPSLGFGSGIGESGPPTSAGNTRLSEGAERSRRRQANRDNLVKIQERLDNFTKYFRDVGVLPPAEEAEEEDEEEVPVGNSNLPLPTKTRQANRLLLVDIEAQTSALEEAIKSYQSLHSPGGGAGGGAGGGEGEGEVEAPFVDTFTQGIETRFSNRKWVGYIDSKKADDGSGIAHSRVYDDILYQVNDDGDKHVVVINSTTGHYLNRIDIYGADSIDYEDLAVGPCLYGNEPDPICIYIADTGKYPQHILRLPEPNDPVNDDDIYVDWKYEIDYAGSIESMFVTPSGDIYLLTEDRPFDLIRVHRENENINVTTWEECAKIKSPNGKDPTAADVSDDGTIVLVKTDDSVVLFHVPDGKYSEVLCGDEDTQQVELDYSAEYDGQALCFMPGSFSYLTCTEVDYSALWRYDKLKVSQVSSP